jgi:hypothetical protein
MNRHEAIDKAAQLFIDVIKHNDYRLNDAVYETIYAMSEALALPDAEPVGMKMTQEQLLRTDGRNQFLWWGDVPYGAKLYTHPPKTAEREALCERIDDSFDGQAYRLSEKTITDIRAYLRGE